MRRAFSIICLVADLLWVGGCKDNAAQDPPAAVSVAIVPQTNYGLALRTASLKLVGDLPTLTEVLSVKNSANPQDTYAMQIDRYLADPRFGEVQIEFWRRTFRLGQAGSAPAYMDAAATFAAMLVAQDRPFTELVTATAGTCPTFNRITRKFTEAACTSGNPTVGILSDQGMQRANSGAMAFRRVRWMTEVLLCRTFPVEKGGSGEPVGGGTYDSPWPLRSISGVLTDGNARIDFHQQRNEEPYHAIAPGQAQVCANCHATLNHIAPLVANFNTSGNYFTQIQVSVPIQGEPLARRSDWIPDNEPTAWRLGKPVNNLAGVGALIASDPEFMRCMTKRLWNWAMSRGDVLDDNAKVPDELMAQVDGGLLGVQSTLKPVLRSVLTSAAFTRY